MGHWVNHKKPDSPVKNFSLKGVTVDSEQLSTSHCHSSEYNSVLLVLETLMKKHLLVISYVLKKEQVDILISKNQALEIYLKHHDNVHKTP